MVMVSAVAGVTVSVGEDEGVGVRVDVAGDMGVKVGVRVNVGEIMGVAVGVRVDVGLDTGVDVDVGEVFDVTVVTWLAELLALFGSNSCPETKASLRKLPMDCGMVATTVTLALAPVPIEARLQVNMFTASGVPQLPWLGVMDTILKLLLSRTVRDTLLAVTGPAFATVRV